MLRFIADLGERMEKISKSFVEDLRRKDLYSMSKFSERQVCSAGFLDTYVEACARAVPLVEFLTKALGLRW